MDRKIRIRYLEGRVFGRVMVVYGTRPEAIKCAPLVKALQAADDLAATTVVTGQHREMLDQVDRLFRIVPDHDLDIMAHGQTLTEVFARVMSGVDQIIAADPPDAVVVQGDTTTSTAAALAAFYRQVPVVHLEAGLRSGDLAQPFPEEANRKITTQVAAVHLAPTETNRANLLLEGVSEDKVVVVGNTVIDALHWAVDAQAPFTDPALEELVVPSDADVFGQRRIVLVTCHRRENWGEPMVQIGRALARLARRYRDVTVVLPAHRNPTVRAAVLPALAGIDNVLVTEPLDYGEFVRIMAASHLVLSDSGGVQEEAPALGVPALVMRETTERPEALATGGVALVGTDPDKIWSAATRLLDDKSAHRAARCATSPYGDGTAAAQSLEAIRALLSRTRRLPVAAGVGS
ncbi:MAG: UDP-N-acetylglucosamine 2-epimerase (non-hydrolyzing) [Micrococcales bacterium]|nr:UDP-N-acetylglucosamine 2-epimerase (non-hydrolyzing) [Micrococcales bacterium]MCL2666162.1 UDP-N-acetylglucosamine 2-epimerase (non-hydrolyzing) [Micrococcales bacterium]